MDSRELQAQILAAKHGRPEGYQFILSTYGSRLYGYFLRFCGDGHEAEDLLGDLMLRLVRMLGKYDERGRFEPWLFRIAANLVRDRIRRRKAAPARVAAAPEPADETDLVDNLPAPAEPVDGRLLAEEANAQVMAALNTLDDGTRQMILLRHFAEMSFAEIAEVMDCPLGTVLAKVHRGLKTLRGRLESRAGRNEQ